MKDQLFVRFYLVVQVGLRDVEHIGEAEPWLGQAAGRRERERREFMRAIERIDLFVDWIVGRMFDLELKFGPGSVPAGQKPDGPVRSLRHCRRDELKVVLWAYDLSTDGPWQSSESAALAVKSGGLVSWRDGRLCSAANEAIKA